MGTLIQLKIMRGVGTLIQLIQMHTMNKPIYQGADISQATILG